MPGLLPLELRAAQAAPSMTMLPNLPSLSRIQIAEADPESVRFLLLCKQVAPVVLRLPAPVRHVSSRGTRSPDTEARFAVKVCVFHFINVYCLEVQCAISLIQPDFRLCHGHGSGMQFLFSIQQLLPVFFAFFLDFGLGINS